MKHSKLTYLSVIGFLGLCVVITYKIIFTHRPFSISLWLGFCTKFAILLFGVIIIPVSVLLGVCNYFNVLNDFVLIGVWVCVYLLGVVATGKLERWSVNALH